MLPLQIAFGQKEIAEKSNEKKEKTTTPAPNASFFEKLLRANPEDRRIYNAYAQDLIEKKKFEKAIEVYQRALQKGNKLQNNNGTSLQEVIEAVRALEKFSKAMEKEPSWGQARKISFDGGELTTNIPQEYSEPLARDLAIFAGKEKAMLEEILGPPKKKASFLKVSVAGRPEEYKVLWREKEFSQNELSPGAYSIGGNEIVIFFPGTDVRWALAQELAHYFLREFYMEQPSRFLDEGLANYLSFKLAEAGANPVAKEILGRLKDLYREGKLKIALDIFPSWERYDQSLAADEKEEFYLRAWSLTSFFLDGGSPFFSKLFRDYLRYELQRGPLSRKDVEDYFRANLSEEKVRNLDGQWGLFIKKMNYDNS
jgi:tetratricopeptide (TPR) repeat protein